MRKPRRFNNRPDLKGSTKDRKFTLVVGVDISGSMSTKEIMAGLSEIHHICKLTKTNMKLIQIDTEVHDIQTFDDKTKLFERKGAGGTYMGDCPKYIKDKKIECDALVMISDMYIEDVSTDDIWKSWKKRTIWLATEDLIPDWNGWNKHTVLPLKV
jgi:predicted metal-dependent peptidase